MMTTVNEARSAVYQRLIDNPPAAEITFDGESFDPPATAWVRLSVRTGVGRQETLGRQGNRRFRRPARVVAQVYTRADEGTKENDDLCEYIQNLYEAISFSGLDFNNGRVRESPEEGVWRVQIVEVAFDYDEIK